MSLLSQRVGGVTKHARKPAFYRFLGVKNVAKWRGLS